MTDSIPVSVMHRFDNPRARPRVLRVYSPLDGWTDSPLRRILTWGVAQELRSQGFTLALARWRFATKQVSLLHLGEIPTTRR